jgi:hypothetical protein
MMTGRGLIRSAARAIKNKTIAKTIVLKVYW